jgi:hypothetical protein
MEKSLAILRAGGDPIGLPEFQDIRQRFLKAQPLPGLLHMTKHAASLNIPMRFVLDWAQPKSPREVVRHTREAVYFSLIKLFDFIQACKQQDPAGDDIVTLRTFAQEAFMAKLFLQIDKDWTLFLMLGSLSQMLDARIFTNFIAPLEKELGGNTTASIR